MMVMPQSQEVRLRRFLVPLLLLIDFLEIASAVCPSGFFGLHCRYGCRCSGLNCDENGNCLPNTACITGYFGPQCQYINVVNVNSKADWAHDDNDTTCNPSASPQQVTVKLVTVTLMSWFRIHVKNPQGIGDVSSAISVKLNGTVDCINKHVYTFRSEVLDVSCDNIALISSIAINGGITPHICNVLVSGDFTRHNISLATYLGQALAFSHTLIGMAQRITSVFSLDFKPFDSLRVQITPHVEFCELGAIGEAWCELARYGYDCEHPCQCQPNQICFSPTGMCGPECASGSYGFMCSLKCGRGCLNQKCDYRRGNCACKPGFKDDNVCETEHSQKTNGTNSPRNCSGHCKETSNCDRISGDCTECADGYFGSGCHFQCPAECLNRRCKKMTGECYSCAKGRFGGKCTNEYPQKTNGTNSPGNCTGHCKETSNCDTVSGDCTECADNYFGSGCHFQCPRECLNMRCNKMTGECDSCAKGRFGGNCTKECSEDCLNFECDITTGSCPQCEPSIFGDWCQPSESWSSLWPALIAIPIAIALCIAALWLARRKPNVVTLKEDDKLVTEKQEPDEKGAAIPQTSTSGVTNSTGLQSMSIESEV